MPKYQEAFKLGIKDIALIENALRSQVQPEIELLRNSGSKHTEMRKNNREIQGLLGKINSQKIFFSEVNSVSHPKG